MRKEITITLLLVFIVVALILGMKFATGSFEESDAKKFVLEDLKTRFPGADRIEIVGVEQKANDKGSAYYFIKASVSDGLTTPCPARTHYYYNYPEQNFVPAPPEYVVKGCRVCTSQPCMIAFPEEAIIASHTLMGAEAVHSYVTASQGAVPEVNKTGNDWRVLWTSSLNYSYEVAVSGTGTILSAEKI